MRYWLRATKGNATKSAKFPSLCVSSLRASLISTIHYHHREIGDQTESVNYAMNCLINVEENMIFVIDILSVILTVYRPITLSE
jgi:hypothetical protein